MILLRHPVKYREWWNTELSRKWPITGMFARQWARHLAPLAHMDADNDRDHLPW